MFMTKKSGPFIYPCFTHGFRKIWILFPLNQSHNGPPLRPPKRCFRGSQTRWTSRRWDAQVPYQSAVGTQREMWNLWWQKWWFDSDKIKIFHHFFKMIIIFNLWDVKPDLVISVMGYLQWTFSNKMVKGDVRSVGKWGIHGPFSTNGNENISWGYLRGMSPAIVV